MGLPQRNLTLGPDFVCFKMVGECQGGEGAEVYYKGGGVGWDPLPPTVQI